jgi:CHAT domain-containing protein
VIAGPGLRYATAEAEVVAGWHPGAVRVAARRDEVLAALAGADLVHVAAHGTFNPASPLLSALRLEDGPMNAYDLLRLDRAPRLVVLSSCDSGMAHAPADGAPLGLAGTFLDRGARCVVAGMVPIRDEDALALMTGFHALLAAGHSPAAALAEAARRHDVHGFTCFGAG